MRIAVAIDIDPRLDRFGKCRKGLSGQNVLSRCVIEVVAVVHGDRPVEIQPLLLCNSTRGQTFFDHEILNRHVGVRIVGANREDRIEGRARIVDRRRFLEFPVFENIGGRFFVDRIEFHLDVANDRRILGARIGRLVAVLCRTVLRFQHCLTTEIGSIAVRARLILCKRCPTIHHRKHILT